LSDRRDAYRIRLQWAVVKAQAHRLPGGFLRWFCQAGARRIARSLADMPGVVAVYARHTHPGSPSFVPGHSDLDLTVVLADEAGKSAPAVETVAGFLERRRLPYYYLSPDDARITTVGELNRLSTRWPPVEILVGPENWTLLAGEDVRPRASTERAAEQWPGHPEFNRWWGHILQDYLLRTLPGLENRYHRVFYRGAIKQAAYFMVAGGLNPPDHEAFTSRGLAKWVLEGNPALGRMLSELERNGFWEGGQSDVREQIFLEILGLTEQFYARFPGPSDATESIRHDRPSDERHASAYDALAAKLASLPDLQSRLAGVLVYPTPYCHPCFYQADFLLPAGGSLADLKALTAIIRETFAGREFESMGHHFAITLVPATVYQAPLAFRGSPFPFLAEHVRRYGRLLPGSPAVTPGRVDGQAWTEWCRMFLPYFTSNLNRRVEHSSRTLNFCHIAAVRLFLETGEIETDPLALRVRHARAFGDGSPSPETWDYLLRDKPGRADRERYRSAAACLAREVQAVERLLAGPGR
jgi:hypothetical protein